VDAHGRMDGKAAQHVTAAKNTVAACRAGPTGGVPGREAAVQCSGRSIAMIKAFSGTAAGTGEQRGFLLRIQEKDLWALDRCRLCRSPSPAPSVGPWIHAGPSFPWRNKKQMGVEGCPWIHASIGGNWVGSGLGEQTRCVVGLA
jgi:hypothetical protein